MEFQHIELSRLVVSPVNMRGAVKKPDITNILPSVRARGILVPLIVRPGVVDGDYEVVAGHSTDATGTPAVAARMAGPACICSTDPMTIPPPWICRMAPLPGRLEAGR